MAESYKRTITLGLDYSSFSEGMKDCNTKMKELDAEFKASKTEMEYTANSSQKLQKQTEYLSEKIEVQNKKVELAKERFNALKESGDATEKQLSSASIAVSNETAKLNELNNQLVETTISQTKLKETIAVSVAVIGGIAAAFTKCAKECAEFADNILTLSMQTNVSTDTLQEWAYAADLVDVSLETMTGSLSKLEKSMASAENKSSASAKAFRELGVRTKDASGHMRNAEDVFYDVIDALGKIPNATERDQKAMEIFGKSARDLAGVINAGSDGLKAYGDEARKLGIIMSQDELQAAGEFQDAMDKLDAQIDALKQRLGLEVIPVLTKFVEVLNAIPAPVLVVIANTMAAVAAIVSVSAAINSVVKSVSVIGGVLGKINPVMDVTYLKILAIVGVVALLVSMLVVLTGKANDATRMMQAFNNTKGVPNINLNTGHNATGTKSWRGGPTWVGENGPEVVDVPAGSRIYNNEETKNFGGDTYNINMNCDLSKMRSVSDVVDAIKGIKNSSALGGVY